ncbi:MAG TPA: DUF2321 domain-containing protein [Bryobacteraceae bacterium]|nr:DUF2321 domain-containing protein [Bryobacteraceae bacterium]
MQNVENGDPVQVCRNGHAVNFSAIRAPHRNKPHCPWCGAPTLTRCPVCDDNIMPIESGILGSRTVPPFCGHCGNAMPWAEEAFRLTEELIDVIDDIPDEVKPALKQCLPDLIGDTPAAPIAGCE